MGIGKSKRWYRVVLTGGDHASRVVAPGEHLGEALGIAMARRPGTVPIAAAALPTSEVPLGESIGKGAMVEDGDVPPWPGSPGGVLRVLPTPTSVDGWGPAVQLTVGYVRHDGPGLVIEAQPPVDKTVEIFLDLVEKMPTIDNIEVRLCAQANGAQAEIQAESDEVWLSPRLNSKQAIRFLDDHDVELLGNGHIEVAVYLRAERSTLRLTEHKTILWLSEDVSTEARITALLAEAGIKPLPALVTMAEVPHLHYRPMGSNDHVRLGKRLHKMRLRRVATLPIAR